MNKKTTKRSLLASVLALALCVVMLVGTTFAWFTDTASTSVNKIQAGNLKVDIVGEDGQSLKGETLKWVKAAGHESEEVLWEPGAEYNLTPFKIVNKGNLALKYEVTINGVDGSSKLLEAIVFTVKSGEQTFDINGWEGILLPAGKTAAEPTEEVGETGLITISGKMNPDAGNEYQGLSIEGISITVKATQYTYEYDSIGNRYDANAPATLPEGITADSFTDGNTLYMVKADGTAAYFKNLKDAMEATSSEDSVIYAKPNATIAKKDTHYNILGNLTVYGNGADFGNVDISAEQYADFSGDVTVSFINTKNLQVWGTRNTEHTLTLNFENCYNDGSRLYYVNKGGSGENHVTIKNCEIGNIESPIYGSNTGSLLIESCTFRNADVAVNINTKLAGHMTTTIRDCVFVDCARNNGSFAAYNGVIRLVNTNAGCTDKATVENCRFVYSDSAAALQGDILLGDTREIAAKPCYPIELTVKNTNAVVQEYNDGLATRQTVAVDAVIRHEGIANAVLLTPASVGDNYQSNTTYILTDGNYGAFTATMEQNRTNVTFVAVDGAAFDSVTIRYHGGMPTADAIAAKNDSTLTVKGFRLNGDMDINTFDRNVVVQGNSVESIKVKTNHVSDMDVRVLDNKIGAGDAKNGYGIYFVPNTSDYDLTISGNTFTGTLGHAIAVQGNGDGAAVTAANSISVTGNVFDSYGLNGKADRAAFKIWYDTKLASHSNQPLNAAATALIRSVQENNSFGTLGSNCVLGNFHDTIAQFH